MRDPGRRYHAVRDSLSSLQARTIESPWSFTRISAACRFADGPTVNEMVRLASPPHSCDAIYSQEDHMKSSTITTLGIDLGKNSVHIFGADSRGVPIVRKRVTRSKLL